MADPFLQQQLSAEIPAGSAESGQVDLGGYSLVGIAVPSNWTTADLTFQASADDGATWYELADTSGLVTIPSLSPGSFVALDPKSWIAVRSLKVRSGTESSPVNQLAAVTVTLLTRAVF